MIYLSKIDEERFNNVIMLGEKLKIQEQSKLKKNSDDISYIFDVNVNC